MKNSMHSNLVVMTGKREVKHPFFHSAVIYACLTCNQRILSSKSLLKDIFFNEVVSKHSVTKGYIGISSPNVYSSPTK